LRAGKRPGQHRENRTVGGSELGSLDLAAQHTELVAQDGDLHVLGVLASQAPEQDADEPAYHEVEEGQSHRSILVYPGPCCSTHAAGFLNPTGVAAGQQDEQLDGVAECQVGELRQHAGSLRDGSVEASPYRAMIERMGSSEATSDFAHPTW